MSTTSITPGLLSDWAVHIARYTDGSQPAEADYLPLRGITDFTPPVIEKNQEDDGDYDNGVWGSQTSTGLSWKIEGTCKLPRGGMSNDPGQQILKAAGIGVAEAGYVHVRCFNKVSGEGWEGVADSTFTSNGGPKTDLTTAAFSLTGRGELKEYSAAPGVQADATARAIVEGGVITGATISKGGSGYTKAPTVKITGAGTGATATASVANGEVVDVNITAGGTGYSKPAISFTRAS